MDDVNDLNGANGLKVVQLNCRSIYGKIEEIKYLYKDVDILSCSETWLSGMMPDSMVSIPNMELFRWDREKGYPNGVTKHKGGGVACYISNKMNLDCQLIPDLTFTNKDIELMSLRGVYMFGKIITIISIYRPPDGSIENFFSILNKIFDENPLGNNDLWLLGDFNIDFLKRLDIKTKKLYEFLRLNGLKQHIKVPTRFTGFGKSCIDFIISNIDDAHIVACGTLNDVISDHLPVYMCVKRPRNNPEFTKIKGRTYKNYNKINFQNLIKVENWGAYYQLGDPSELWNYILKIVRRHLDIMCPLKYIRFRLDSPPWINQEVIELINDRSMCYKIAKSSGQVEDIRNARQARNRINRFIKSAKSNFIKETLNQHKNNPKKFWKILNGSLLKDSIDNSYTTFDKGDGNYTSTDDACEYINNHFASIGARLHNQFKDTVPMDLFNDVYNIQTVDDESDFTVEDILSVVNNINVYKSSGIDYIPTFVLKDCFEVIVPQITYMFNQSLSLGIFPESWSTATITPIPKSGNRSFVNNWRPISIIPLIGKLLEKLCSKLVNSHLEINNILCDEQYGFRPKKSTSLAIFTYIKNITEELNKRKLVGSIYLDFAKAFDSINHLILLAKLENMGFSKKLVKWIQSYLGKRKIRTKLNNSFSTTQDLLCGVPQGSILGPTLFLCYINDLAITIKQARANISLFADDAVIYCSNYDHFFIKARLEHMLGEIKKWCNCNRINMNIDKTKYCLYGSRKMVNTFSVTWV